MTANDYIVLFMIHVGLLDKLEPRTEWVNSSINNLYRADLIDSTGHDASTTARGIALIDHIKALPLPVQDWRMPT